MSNFKYITGSLNFNFNSGDDIIDRFYYECLYELAYWKSLNKSVSESTPKSILSRIYLFFNTGHNYIYEARFFEYLVRELKYHNQKQLRLISNPIFKRKYIKTEYVIKFLNQNKPIL